jgi:hypothetical protein
MHLQLPTTRYPSPYQLGCVQQDIPHILINKPQPKSMGTRIWILNTWDFSHIDPLFSVHIQPVSDL